ncbi:MAG: hypothetical protein P3T54_02915 [Dehalogenimonas sp.]|uniref:HEAT repeat domain-containing protein n=1 Tax=Candidatus Dehalogenimonas loeffleri TaxID=3127115 RepID=A0ABZ2J1C6_9CHLR|nr:hypothetical protein [Dehalogenimonas sp.]
MNKHIIRFVALTLALAALTFGAVTTFAADAPPANERAASNVEVTLEQITERILQMENRDRVVALLDRLVDNDRITQGQANQILKAWDDAHPDWKPLIERLTDRILQMENRDRVVALLDRLVDNDRITQGQANQILKAWDDAHPDWKPLIERLTDRILQMENRDRVVALQDRLVDNDRITQGQANQILKAWDDAHPGWTPPVSTG